MFKNTNHKTQAPREKFQNTDDESDIIVKYDASENIKLSIVKKQHAQVKFYTKCDSITNDDNKRHHDIQVKCEVLHATSSPYPQPLATPIPQYYCQTEKYHDTLVRYNSSERYEPQTVVLPPQLPSDSSSTLSSAWDIDVDAETACDSDKIERAPIAHFRR